MTVAEKLRLLAEFAETGEEFEIIGDWDELYKFEVFVENGSLIYMDDSKRACYSHITFNKLIDEQTTIARLPFKPKHGEDYYFIDITSRKGYRKYSNEFMDLDQIILSRETVYRTEAEAQEEVRKRGWKVEN
jgi:hypothetical protein